MSDNTRAIPQDGAPTQQTNQRGYTGTQERQQPAVNDEPGPVSVPFLYSVEWDTSEWR